MVLQKVMRQWAGYYRQKKARQMGMVIKKPARTRAQAFGRASAAAWDLADQGNGVAAYLIRRLPIVPIGYEGSAL